MSAAPLAPLPQRDLDEMLEATRDLWRVLSGERVFVTGGTGFFGVWLLESFVWANRKLGLNARAVVLSRDPAAFARRAPQLAASAELSFVQGSAHDFALPDGKLAAIVHGATESYTPDVDRLAAYERDVAATRRTLELAERSGAKRYLFTSSGAVYGKQPSELTHVPETYLGAPEPSELRSGYGQAKRASEFLCTLYASRGAVQPCIARCFAFVGPALPLDANYAIGNFLRDALAGGPIRIGGDGTPFRSYMYASDLVTWLWTILFRGEPARPYNVGSDADLDIAALAQRVRELVAPNAQVLRAQDPVPGAAPLRYVPAIERAKRELGLGLRVDLAEAIRRTVAWHTG